jgi:hypothetical protein
MAPPEVVAAGDCRREADRGAISSIVRSEVSSSSRLACTRWEMVDDARHEVAVGPRLHAGAQHRSSALRQFRILECNAVGTVDCTEVADYTLAFISPADAFSRSHHGPGQSSSCARSTSSTSPQRTCAFEVVTNQCTGGPGYAGEQDADPRAGTDSRRTVRRPHRSRRAVPGLAD